MDDMSLYCFKLNKYTIRIYFDNRIRIYFPTRESVSKEKTSEIINYCKSEGFLDHFIKDVKIGVEVHAIQE